MKISVILPYEHAERSYKVWAHEEREIDFLSDPYRAERCTLSHAAEELVSHLAKAGLDASVNSDESDLEIYLVSEGGVGEEFTITAEGKKIILTGVSRTATLYAAYELLEANGFRWYSPKNSYVPKLDSVKAPSRTAYKYSMPKGRGYHFEGLLKESYSIITWMARNRMSLSAPYAHSVPLLRKLGFTLKIGGHIFGDIINPKNYTENGELYIDAHRDWYGKREGEITAENALEVQFCVSNRELLDTLSDVVVKKCKNEWRDADILELAGFDTWGKSCACRECKKLGGGSDLTLHFLSHIRDALNLAYEKGEIRKNPRLTFDIYEGTDTMQAPENPVPENLIKAGDYGMFCPILRCFKHNIYDDCEKNRFYNECLLAWSKTGFDVAINEYYNVSKFEDLPILFSERMKNDIPYYVKCGAVEIGYMHFSVAELGIRRLNEYLLANISRDISSDVSELKDGYFKGIYGKYSERVSEIYEKCEKATALCASYRAWFDASILTPLMTWDGLRPTEKLKADSHIDGNAAKIAYGIQNTLKDAANELREIRLMAVSDMANEKMGKAFNPHDVAKSLALPPIIETLNEDVRGLIYGADVFGFMALMIDYHDSLLEGRNTDLLYEKIKSLGEKMSEYTYGINYAAHTPERELRSALVRSQLSKLYYNIIANGRI